MNWTAKFRDSTYAIPVSVFTHIAELHSWSDRCRCCQLYDPADLLLVILGLETVIQLMFVLVLVDNHV